MFTQLIENSEVYACVISSERTVASDALQAWNAQPQLVATTAPRTRQFLAYYEGIFSTFEAAPLFMCL